MKAQIGITPKFEDVNSSEYITALVLEGGTDLIIDIRGGKEHIKGCINKLLAEYGLYAYQHDYKEKYDCDGVKGKVKYYYQELPVLITVDIIK